MRRLLAIALAIGVPGCSGGAPSRSPPPSAPPLATIAGQVFIALRNQDVVKLALVDVSALPESDLEAFKSRAEATKQTVLAAAGELQKAQGTHVANAAKQKLLYEEAGDMPREPRQAKLAEANALGAAEPALRKRFAGSLAALKAACALNPFPAINTLHQQKTVTTDADGKFELRGLRQGSPYLIAASASRDVLGQTERYFWLIRVVPQSASMELPLNNRNLLTTIDAPLVKLFLCGGGSMPSASQ